MSSSRRGAIFALGFVAGGALAVVLLVWFVGLNYCPNSPCQYDRAYGEQGQYYVYDVPLARGPNTTGPFTEADNQGHPDYYNRQDLRAQESMARATNAIVIWTASGVIIAVVGMVALIGTLGLQRRANEIAVQVGQDQSRAYLHVERIDFYWGNKERSEPRAEVWITNSGQTPARNFWARLAVIAYKKGASLADGGPPEKWDDIQMPDFLGQPFNAVAAQGEVMTDFNLASDFSELDKALALAFGFYTPDNGVSFFGEVSYETFFGEHFISQFCFAAHELRGYRAENERMEVIDGFTTQVADEIPIPLKRFAFPLETYKRIQG